MVSFAGPRLRCSGRTVISRQRFLTGAAITLAPLGAAVHAQEYKAQQPKRPWRIGMFNAGVRLPESVAGQEWFREELRSCGYVQGQKVVYEERWAEGHAERLPDLAADLVRLNVDVIVAVGTAQALAARKVTTTIPIVVVSATFQSRWAWSPAWHDRAASEEDEGCKGPHQGPESHLEWAPKAVRAMFRSAQKRLVGRQGLEPWTR